MGHIQDMNDQQRLAWYKLTYQRKKEANIGFNYPYFNQEKWNELERNGYEMYLFTDAFKNKVEGTMSVLEAKEVVEKLRSTNHYARIICGYIQTKQSAKHYTVIFKNKVK
jgi:hypothetical protein